MNSNFPQCNMRFPSKMNDEVMALSWSILHVFEGIAGEVGALNGALDIFDRRLFFDYYKMSPRLEAIKYRSLLIYRLAKLLIRLLEIAHEEKVASEREGGEDGEGDKQ